MALFGKKKSEASGPPIAPVASSDNGAFDFDAIARDLDAQGGASSFDSLLAQPAQATTPGGVTRAPGGSAFDDSVFDFDLDPVQTTPLQTPHEDPFDLPLPPPDAVQPQPAPAPTASAPTASPTSSFAPAASAPAAPMASAPVAPTPIASLPDDLDDFGPVQPVAALASHEAAPATEAMQGQTAPPTPTEPPSEGWVNVAPKRKSLPLVPILGALGLLTVAGGGAMLFLNSQKEAPDDTAVPAPTRPVKSSSTKPASAPVSPGVKPSSSATTAPIKPASSTNQAPAKAPEPPRVAPTSTPVISAPAKAPTAPHKAPTASHSVSPGIAPVTSASANGQAGAASVTITPSGPSATQGLSPTLAAQLKQLWKTGADAKHSAERAAQVGDQNTARRDYQTARQAWQEALRLHPGHPGFGEAINKLPK